MRWLDYVYMTCSLAKAYEQISAKILIFNSFDKTIPLA